MSQLDELQKDVQNLVEFMRNSIEALGVASFPKRIFPVFCRAILTRQFESLDTISHLVQENMGHAAPPLLRPSCEEYIWLSYLNSISVNDAEELIVCMNDREQLDMVKAQNSYGEPGTTEFLGLLPIVQIASTKKQEVNKRLRGLRSRLGWRSDRLPTVGWLARKTRKTRMYKFLYAATSRFVHFSGMELLRRSQGPSEKVAISSTHYRDYWAAFALYWGFHLFDATLIETRNTPGLSDGWMDWDDWTNVTQRIQEQGKVPIITGDEVALS